MLNVSYSLKSDFSPDLKLFRHRTFTRFSCESFTLSNAYYFLQLSKPFIEMLTFTSRDIKIYDDN